MLTNRYEVIEFDANDKSLVLRSGLTKGEARALLAKLRATYADLNLRFIMRRIAVAA